VKLFRRRKQHWQLLVVLAIYLALAVVHSIVAPLTIGNDEYAHFLYTRFIAEHGRLPVTRIERDNTAEVGTKSDDPPLYHLLAAAVASGVDPDRYLRPVNGDPRRQLADNVVVSYAFLVHTGYELWPYYGEVLLWHLGRGVSIFFGGLLIALTCVTSLLLFPGRRRALVAAALLAFIPAFIFHTSVMSYDSLGAVLTAIFLLVSIKAIKRPDQWRWWLLLGILAGAAMTTKYTSVLLPLEIVFVAWLAFRRENSASVRILQLSNRVTSALARILAAGLVMILAVSWWFGSIVWNFNTIESQGIVVGVLEPLLVRGGNDSTAIRITAFLFGGEAVSADLPPPARARNYPELAWIMLQSFWSARVAESFVLSPWLPWLFALLAVVSLVGLWWAWQRAGPELRTWLALLLFHTLLILPLIVMRVFISFDPVEAVQGRHLLLPAASAISILLVWGWDQWSHRLGPIVVAVLLVWSVLGQVGWAAVTYPPPMPVWSQEALPNVDPQPMQPVDETLVDGMALVGVSWSNVSPAKSLEVTLWWRALAPMGEDYLVELTLLDEAGSVAGYTVSHPVGGRYPTRAWEPDDLVKDVHWLPAVDQLVGDYQLQLRLLDRAGQPVALPETISLGTVALATPARRPDPCAVWFQGQPDWGGVFFRPYWLRSAFTVVGSDEPVLKPQSVQGDWPEQTPSFSVGNFHVFIVGPEWAESYRLFAGETACGDISIELSPRNFVPPEIPSPLEVTVNNEVKLLGYDLPARRARPGERLPLTLYWQGLAYMAEDYRIFDNLLDRDQQRWGGYDRRARDGYSTLLWAPGEVIIDAFGVPVDPVAPDGIYTLDIGLYRQDEDRAVSLPITVDGQPVEQHSIRLGPIKVGGPPPEVVVSDPSPQVRLDQPFGEEITLLGYDLVGGHDRGELDPDNLELTLYWRADEAPKTDYTTFLHLRNSANENVAQKDRPPANGLYPTSLWDAGEIIVDEISVPLAGLPVGKYSLVVGLYDFATGARLPVEGQPANELQLESVVRP
jgi:4-amino-4-deoxy-L-arabinose transferase-like glycosyltransferase